MGRETYTFTLNHQKLSTTLADKLEAELNGDRLPFGKYVEEEDSKLNDYHREMYNRTKPLTADEIIHVLRTEPKRADILHLSIPFSWLWDFYHLGDTGDDVETWLNYGYEIIYELGQKDKCWVYVCQLGSYNFCNGINFGNENYSCYDGDYHLYESSVYNDAIKYLLILLRKLWQDGPDSRYMSQYDPQKLALATDDIKDDKLEQQASQELKKLRERNPEKDSWEYKVPETMFPQIKEVQQTLQTYEGKIFIWDNI